MNIIDLYDYDFDVMNLACDLNTMYTENKHAFEKQCYMITADALRRLLNNINDLEGDLCHLSEKLKETELSKRKLWHLLNDADIAAFNAASEQEYVNWCERIGRVYEEQDERAEETAWIEEQAWKWNSKSRAAEFARNHNLSREDAEKWYDMTVKNNEINYDDVWADFTGGTCFQIDSYWFMDKVINDLKNDSRIFSRIKKDYLMYIRAKQANCVTEGDFWKESAKECKMLFEIGIATCSYGVEKMFKHVLNSGEFKRDAELISKMRKDTEYNILVHILGKNDAAMIVRNLYLKKYLAK